MNSIFIEAPKKKIVMAPSNTTVSYKKPVIANTKLENSLNAMKASFEEIDAAKHHTVVINAPSSRKVVAGQKKKIITKAGVSTSNTAPSTSTSTSTANTERKPIIVGERKAAKKSNISKLLKGKKFDMS